MIPPQVIVSWISEVQRWGVLCTYCFKVDTPWREQAVGNFISAHKHEDNVPQGWHREGCRLSNIKTGAGHVCNGGQS